MVSVSFMLFIHTNDLSHLLCYSTFFRGFIYLGSFLLFFLTLTNVYFDSLIRFLPPSGFLISGSNQSCIHLQGAIRCELILPSSFQIEM